MTTLWVEALTLEFSYNRIRIPDTEPGLTVDQGRPGFRDRDCLVTGPDDAGSKLSYAF
jgi:hypothetical protein